jgi:hypothetical protein
MKNSRTKSITLFLAIGYGLVFATQAAPESSANTSNVIRSVFVMPSDSREGRDPFFPNSTRPYKLATSTTSRSSEVSSLVIKGFSGSTDHRLVIINNHTFAPGDEGDVITSSGRIHLSCVEIKTNSVVIEVGGERHELFYFDKQ